MQAGGTLVQSKASGTRTEADTVLRRSFMMCGVYNDAVGLHRSLRSRSTISSETLMHARKARGEHETTCKVAVMPSRKGLALFANPAVNVCMYEAAPRHLAMQGQGCRSQTGWLFISVHRQLSLAQCLRRAQASWLAGAWKQGPSHTLPYGACLLAGRRACRWALA